MNVSEPYPYRESTCMHLRVSCSYEICIHFVLEQLNITSIQTINGEFLPYVDSPLGEGILSNIQSTLFLHQREVVPSVISLCAILRKKY